MRVGFAGAVTLAALSKSAADPAGILSAGRYQASKSCRTIFLELRDSTNEPFGLWRGWPPKGMLKPMIDRIFEAFVALILAVGSVHTIAGIYRGRLEQRRWREAVKRLKFGVSNLSN